MIDYYKNRKAIDDQETKEKERSARIRSLLDEAKKEKNAAADAQAKAAAEAGTKSDRVNYYLNK